MTEYAEPIPLVVDGEVVAVNGVPATLADAMPQPLRYPPALRPTCACGKDASLASHGFNPATGHRALSCAEVLAIQARVEADLTRRPTLASQLVRRIVGGA